MYARAALVALILGQARQAARLRRARRIRVHAQTTPAPALERVNLPTEKKAETPLGGSRPI